jgi:CheY-like chemotaxis protein
MDNRRSQGGKPTKAEASGKAVLSGYRILVVDDEPDQRVFISTVLEDNGAEILSASDGDTAIAMARKERPDLITLDLAMPGKNGIDVFSDLRGDPELKTIPVCIITGKPEMRKLIYERPGGLPPEGYINKPINEKMLLQGVRLILEVPKRKDQRTQGSTSER